MAFKDKLIKCFEEKGGSTPDNLADIAHRARKVQPDFTLNYLTRLMFGHPPRPQDYQALGVAFGISPSNLIDDDQSRRSENRRKAEQFMTERLGKPGLAKPFVEFLETGGKFRSQNLTPDDLYILSNEFFQTFNDFDDEDLS